MYSAEHKDSGEKCALKFCSIEELKVCTLALTLTHTLALMLILAYSQEIKDEIAMQSLNRHPNVVALHEAFLTQDKICLSMELMSGLATN